MSLYSVNSHSWKKVRKCNVISILVKINYYDLFCFFNFTGSPGGSYLHSIYTVLSYDANVQISNRETNDRSTDTRVTNADMPCYIM